MPATRSALSYDVFVAPEKPFAAPLLLRDAALPDQELFDAMVDRYPGWVSRQQWLMLEAVA